MDNFSQYILCIRKKLLDVYQALIFGVFCLSICIFPYYIILNIIQSYNPLRSTISMGQVLTRFFSETAAFVKKLTHLKPISMVFSSLVRISRAEVV